MVSVNPDADAVIAENPSNKPPAEGNRFLISRVRIENVARRVNYVWYEFSLVGSSAAMFWSFNSCDIVPDQIEHLF